MASHFLQPTLLLQNTQRTPLGNVIQAGTQSVPRTLPRMPVRRHPFHAAILALRGGVTFEVEGAAPQTVGPGDLMLIFANRGHRYAQTSEDPWAELWVIFEGPVFDLWRDSGVLTPAEPVLRLGAPDFWHKRITSAVGPQPGGLYEQTLRRIALFQQVLADAVGHVRQKRVDPREQAWLAEAYRLIEPQTAPEPPDWQAVSKRLGLSYEGFRKRFARLTGVPPAKHRAARVMDQACTLLQRGLTVAEVAQRCGFYDAFHFSRQFKKTLGLTPRDYRQRFAIS